MVRPVPQRAQARRAQPSLWRVRAAKVALPALVLGLATTGVVAAASGSTTAVPQSAPTADVSLTPGSAATPGTTASPRAVQREQSTSRSETRPALTDAVKKAAAAKKAAAEEKTPAAEPGQLPKVVTPPLTVVDTEYTRVDLNVRSEADTEATLITVLDSGSEVRVTRTTSQGWRWIAYDGAGGWVKDQYLVESKPKPAAKATAQAGSGGSAGVSSGACAGGSAVESGLTPDAVRVHRAVCAQFPGVTAYGGVRADSLPEHPSGRALDAMVSDTDLGWQIAKWVRANAGRLGVSEVLFAQHIWTVQRSGEGWRTFSDRGSATANHYDHVHVTVYGSSGG